MNRIAPALSAALWDGRWSSEGVFLLGKGASGEGVKPSSSELETEVLPLDDPGVAGTPAMLENLEDAFTSCVLRFSVQLDILEWPSGRAAGRILDAASKNY